MKKVEPRLPLWSLFFAVQFLDVLWAVFVLLGIEHYRIVPGITASLPLDLYYIPYTHSLVAALAWSAVVFALCRWMIPITGFRNNRSAFLLALAVLSHWVLDLVVHRPDLPTYDDAYKVGFGLWNFSGSSHRRAGLRRFAQRIDYAAGGSADQQERPPFTTRDPW